MSRVKSRLYNGLKPFLRSTKIYETHNFKVAERPHFLRSFSKAFKNFITKRFNWFQHCLVPDLLADENIFFVVKLQLAFCCKFSHVRSRYCISSSQQKMEKLCMFTVHYQVNVVPWLQFDYHVSAIIE